MLIVYGAGAFGIVVGYVTYRLLSRLTKSGIGDLAAVVGVIGGASVTRFFDSKADQLGAYGIGLLLGFIAFYVATKVGPVPVTQPRE